MRWVHFTVKGVGTIILALTLIFVALSIFLEWSLSAKNLEKYHCVDQDELNANPDDKTPNFYGYHVILGGDKRGFFAKKERSLRLISAQHGEKLSRRVQLRPIGYDVSFCSSELGVGYQFTDYHSAPPKLTVSWTIEGAEEIEKAEFQCSRYEDIHWHRYYNLQRGHPPLASREMSDEVRSCPY